MPTPELTPRKPTGAATPGQQAPPLLTGEKPEEAALLEKDGGALGGGGAAVAGGRLISEKSFTVETKSDERAGTGARLRRSVIYLARE